MPRLATYGFEWILPKKVTIFGLVIEWFKAVAAAQGFDWLR